MKRVTSGKIIQLRMGQIIFGRGTRGCRRRGRLCHCPRPCPQETFAAVAHEPLAHREIMKIFFRAASIFPDNCWRPGCKEGRTYSSSQIQGWNRLTVASHLCNQDQSLYLNFPSPRLSGFSAEVNPGSVLIGAFFGKAFWDSIVPRFEAGLVKYLQSLPDYRPL